MAFPWAIAFAVASLVFSASSLLLGLLNKPKTGPGESERIQVDTLGKRIAKTFGTDRVKAECIWARKWDLGGGKWSYLRDKSYEVEGAHIWHRTAQFALSLGHGPIVGILRIWIAGKLVYDNRPSADAKTRQASRDWWDKNRLRLYLGTDNQTQDPLIAAVEGAANVPAYVGLAYLVVPGLYTDEEFGFELKDYGDTFAQWEVEVVGSGSVTASSWNPVTRVAENATVGLWAARKQAKAESYNGRLWLFCGHNGTTALSDVWSSADGETWRKEASLPDYGAGLYVYSEKDNQENKHNTQGTELPAQPGKRTGFGLAEGYVLGGNDGSISLYSRLYNPTGASGLDLRDRAYANEIDPIDGAGFCAWAENTTDANTGSAVVKKHLIAAGGRTVASGGGITVSRSLWDRVFENTALGGGNYGYRWKWYERSTDCGLGYRTGHTLLAYNDEIYAIGGTTYSDAAGNGAAASNTVFKLNTGTWQFTQLSTDLTGGASGAAVIGAVAWNGYIVAFVSGEAGGKLKAYKSTDGATWTALALGNVDDFEAGGAPAFAVHNNRIFMLGGSRAGAALDTVYSADVEAVSSTGPALSSAVEWICTEYGPLTASELNLAAIAGKVERGFTLAERESPRDSCDELRAVHFFDLVETGGKIKAVTRGGVPVLTIPEEDLGLAEGDSFEVLTQVGKMIDELPLQVDLVYPDVEREYNPNTQTSARATTDASRQIRVTTRGARNKDEAATIANVIRDDAWNGLHGELGFVTSWKYAHLDPGDLIATTRLGTGYTLRLSEEDLSRLDRIGFKGVAEDADLYARTYTGVGTTAESTLAAPEEIVFECLDIAILQEAHDDFGFYIVACPDGSAAAWKGAQVWRSPLEYDEWQVVASITAAAAFGVAEGKLASASQYIWDRGNSLTVRLNYGSMASGAERDVLRGAKKYLIGNEILQALTATDNGNGTVTLSTFLRGRHGTEWAIAAHNAGERVIALDNAVRVPLRQGEVGRPYRYKVATRREQLEDAPEKVFVGQGAGKWTFAPQLVRGEKDTSGNWTVEWNSRSRYCDTLDPFTDVKPSENREDFLVDYLDGSGVEKGNGGEGYQIGDLAVMFDNLNSDTYAAAEQTADFGSPQSALRVRIAQIDSQGRAGQPKEITL